MELEMYDEVLNAISCADDADLLDLAWDCANLAQVALIHVWCATDDEADAIERAIDVLARVKSMTSSIEADKQ